MHRTEVVHEGSLELPQNPSAPSKEPPGPRAAAFSQLLPLAAAADREELDFLL